MKHYISLLSFLIFCITVHAQKEVLAFTIKNAENGNSEGYSFSNEENGDLALVLMQNREAHGNLFDSDFNKKGSLESEVIRRKYKDIIGYSVKGNSYHVVAATNNKRKYAVQTFDFDSKSSSIEELKFDFGKEKFLETFQFNNDLYLITATKENKFVLRKLDAANTFSVVKSFPIEVDQKDQKLLNSGFFTVGLFGSASSNVTKIENRVPNAIEQTANANKLYQKDDVLYLTLENDDELKTSLHIIDLNSLTLTTKVYDYPKGKKDDLETFNSFILDDRIIQLGSSRDEMVIHIKDFDGSVLKEYYIDRDEPIAIKNSPIIQEGRTALPFVNRREMEETSKFLRKVTSGKIGVTGYLDNGEYYFTIGGYKNVQSGGGMMMMPGGAGTYTNVSAGNISIPTYNPVWYSYTSYNSTKSTFFNTRFDLDYNYVEKEEEANIFERIKEFKKEVKYDTAEDVFFHQDKLYFGYFDKKEKNYYLYKM